MRLIFLFIAMCMAADQVEVTSFTRDIQSRDYVLRERLKECGCKNLSMSSEYYTPPSTTRIFVTSPYLTQSLNAVTTEVMNSCGKNFSLMIDGNDTIVSSEIVDKSVLKVFTMLSAVVETACIAPNVSEDSILYDIIGFAGPLCIASGLVPQIFKAFQTKQTNDISFGWQFTAISGLFGMLCYSFHEGMWPIYVPCSLEFTCMWILTFQKLWYEGYVNKLVHFCKGTLPTDPLPVAN